MLLMVITEQQQLHLLARKSVKKILLIQERKNINFFLAVHFPADQLQIIDYNRTIKDLNGLTPSELLARLEQGFLIEEKGNKNL